jgi:hypothetical protein
MIKRWVQEKTAVWDSTNLWDMIDYFMLAIKVTMVMGMLPLLIYVRYCKPTGTNSPIRIMFEHFTESSVSGASLTAGKHAQRRRHVDHRSRTLDMV